MKLSLAFAAAFSTAFYAIPASSLAQTPQPASEPTGSDASMPDSGSKPAAPHHKHHAAHHPAAAKKADTDKSFPDSSQETPSETTPK